MTPLDPNTPEFWQKAAALAARAHKHQTRMDERTPYFAHPYRVAMTVRHVFNCDDPIALAAAMLHDTIEDTTIDFDRIAEEFGEEVATVVATVSKDTRLPEPEREPKFYAQIAAGPWQAKLVKLADSYDNLCDAPSAGMLRKAIVHAERGLEAAGDDSRLSQAKRILTELVESKRK